MVSSYVLRTALLALVYLDEAVAQTSADYGVTTSTSAPPSPGSTTVLSTASPSTVVESVSTGDGPNTVRLTSDFPYFYLPRPTFSFDSLNGTSTSTRLPGNATTTTRPRPPSTTKPPGYYDTPDVYLNVPELGVKRIELAVDKLAADLNLAADVAKLVTLNAGVQVRIDKVNITIADVSANLELMVRLGRLVDVVERVFETVDLNPLLIGLVNNATNLIGQVIGVVDGLLGSITQGGKTLNLIVDNLGNIVQEVVGGVGGAVHSIIGNYQQNMTQVGPVKNLPNGLIQKTFHFGPLDKLVDIVFNSAGQVVQAVVQKGKSGMPPGAPGPVVPPPSSAPPGGSMPPMSSTAPPSAQPPSSSSRPTSPSSAASIVNAPLPVTLPGTEEPSPVVFPYMSQTVAETSPS